MEAAVVNNFVNWIKNSDMTANQAFEQLDVARNGSFNAQQLDAALTRAVGSSPPDWVSRAVVKSIKKRAGSSDKSGSVSKNEFLAFLASYGLDITEEVASVEEKIDKAEEIIKPDETEETRDTEEQAEIEEPIEAPEEVVKVETIEEKLQQAEPESIEEIEDRFDERDFDIEREVVVSPAVEREPISFDSARLESVFDAFAMAKLNKEIDHIVGSANEEFTLHCHVKSIKRTLLAEPEYKGGMTLSCSFDQLDREIEIQIPSELEQTPSVGQWFSFKGEICDWNKALQTPVFKCYELL
ncbi:MAG: EF-hand domain-containing protein [Candidatus Thermoplasmatota archaeon]|nr:EF-hand domain-containing protein [Candidatus Thermoplasmatota archaeon]